MNTVPNDTYILHTVIQLSQENFDALIRKLPTDGTTLVVVGIMAWLAETEVPTLINYTHIIVLACLTH